ncbi:CCA tRNA nucleotidyltransferase [Thermoflavimicrobium dichotomicum]|uniref:tRNA nucleotidyltransferase (CCA-adding enzyme) n=1 Tax=Thermoflavimicrobium dichotomicum TaxID=46223 RepID=A0A1I3SP88_9BACL|nr:CCA tRNA nucleotidyltransferase [Thermoflavimicrobium dichotomicum]SFJ59217.1 tRNA nucleotidyltransferase (CCA-adding enzyme) [Thermoflavimicrobium dichotomicum]
MNPKREAALQIMKRLEEAGFESYLVGGCVRDFVLKRPPQDYDVATNALPHKVQSLFPRTVPTGIKHGTVTVIHQGIPIEVTTFRTESDYEDYRHPSHVEFVSSLEQDLSRRDFTMNAMAQDRQGKLYDYYGGLQDIQAKRIRTVGSPFDRFEEDPLRMVRAARFAAQLQFALDPKVKEAMAKLNDKCIHLSVERVVAELEKVWASPATSRGIALLYECGLINYLPPFAAWQVQTPTQAQIGKFDQIPDRIGCWAYLVYLCTGGKKDIQHHLRQLRLANHDVKAIKACYQLALDWPYSLTEDEGKKLLLRHGLETGLRAVQLARILDKPLSASLEQDLTSWWNEMPAKSLKDLAISGQDLIQYQQQPAGPWIKKTLEYLLEKVALGNIPNQKECLLKEGCKVGAEYS